MSGDVVVQAARQVIVDYGGERDETIHRSWRCFDKDRYPDPCDCLDEIAGDLVAAVRPLIYDDIFANLIEFANDPEVKVPGSRRQLVVWLEGFRAPMSDDDIIQAATEAIINSDGYGAVDQARAVVAAVRPLILQEARGGIDHLHLGVDDRLSPNLRQGEHNGLNRATGWIDYMLAGVGGQHTDTPPAKCGLDVGRKPYWMGVDQYDPCPCVLDKGHDGSCDCGNPNHARPGAGTDTPPATEESQ